MKSFTPFIIIAVSIVMYYVLISPLYSDVSALQTKKAQYADVLVKSEQLKTRRDALLAQYNAIQPIDIIKLKRIVPDMIDTVDVVTNINSIASQYGMVVRGVKIADSKNQTDQTSTTGGTSGDGAYQTTGITFSVNGTYSQFVSFLRDLESNARLFDVTSLSIAAGDQKTAGLQYTVGLNTYSFH